MLDDLYSRHENHFSLVSNEPLLCCTILMISSRYHDLTGPGSASRSTLVHHRLWEHCLYLVNRILFGQEQRSNASLRTIGTIQALLLMVEWKPRAIHFPSTADGWDLHLVVPSNTQDQAAANPPDQALQKWLSNVTEPAKSADYVSWMLLGCASSLAHHLGLCSDGDSDSGRPRTADADDMSALRLRKVLYILLELLSLRLGCEPAITATLSQSLSGASLPSRALRDLDSDHRAVNAWLELTSLTRSMSDFLFASPHVTRNIILGGRYVGIIKHFQQQLTKWRDSFADGQGKSPSQGGGEKGLSVCLVSNLLKNATSQPSPATSAKPSRLNSNTPASSSTAWGCRPWSAASPPTAPGGTWCTRRCSSPSRRPTMS